MESVVGADLAGLADRVAEIRARVDTAAIGAGRAGGEVEIVGVSKTFSREAVDAAYAAGIRIFAENRVQEARDKFATPLPEDASVHLIGQLQTNKVKYTIGLFSCIESVDRLGLIEALAKEAAKREVVVPVLLQVNVAREVQKSGCDPDEAASLVDAIVASEHLRLDGLMTIAPFVADPEDARPVFRELRVMRDTFRARHAGLALDVLSMGMSGDFEVAIGEGATHVRIGRALFGSR